MAPFHLGLRICDALQNLGIVDADECEIISSSSERPFYLNLQFLLAPLVGLVILICFVFEDICLPEGPRSEDNSDGDAENNQLFAKDKDSDKKPKADVGRGDDDDDTHEQRSQPELEDALGEVDGNSINRSLDARKDNSSPVSEKDLLERNTQIAEGKKSMPKRPSTQGGRPKHVSIQGRIVRMFRSIYSMVTTCGRKSHEGPLRLTLVDEDGLSNCYHVRGELLLTDLLQLHCGKQETSDMILRQSGRRIDTGISVADAGIRDLDVLDLEANYRKMFVKSRLEAEENNRHLRQQLDLTHKDIHMQQGRLTQFERQMNLHARCAKSNEQQAREYQTRLKRLTSDIAVLQKMSVTQNRTQKLLDRAAENLRLRLEETCSKTVNKTKDSVWIQNLLGVANSELKNLYVRLSRAEQRVEELEKKGSSASIVQDLEDRVEELEKRIKIREAEVAEWKEKWEASSRQAKAALKAVKAGKRAKKLEEEQQKVESNRQKDKFLSEVNALKQKLESQRRASEEQWKRLKEAKVQVDKLKRKLAAQEELKKSMERERDKNHKEMNETCLEWKTKAKSTTRSLSESRSALQQANKRNKDLQKWKKEVEDGVIPNLKRRVEELQKEVESWQSQAHMYSEELKEALAATAQAREAAAVAEAAAAAANKSSSSSTIA
mmetsp:Transcript_7069/g.11169  ORF Transcript_7069/g.11169 Transcript_7069/m.11169 type:complete len:664 (-) Transcript_7069:149-2140(-)